MSTVAFAIAATVGWALTPIAINRGLYVIPGREEAWALSWLLTVALSVGAALAVGFATLLGLDVTTLLVVDGRGTLYAVAAGLLLFPVHNGIYYVTSHAYERSEVVLQFEQLSPLLTVPLGFLAGESVTLVRLAAFVLVVTGTVMLFWISVRGEFGVRPFGLGMVFMVSGSVGGFFAKLATQHVAPVGAILQALVAGVLVQGLVAALWTARGGRNDVSLRDYVRPFAAHGILSFGVAYPAYFYSIQLIGLSSTSLVVVSSPVVALAIILPVRYLAEDTFLSEPSMIDDRSLLAASLVVFVGSVLVVVPL